MRLLLARPMPDAVTDRACAAFETELRTATTPLAPDELRRALRDFDAVIPTLGDRFTADVFGDVPERRPCSMRHVRPPSDCSTSTAPDGVQVAHSGAGP